MNIKKITVLFAISILIISGISFIAQNSHGTENENSFAPHLEKTSPDKTVDRKIRDNMTLHKFTYNYDMNYSRAPENVVINIEGNMDEVDYQAGLLITIKRPDGDDLNRLVEMDLEDNRPLDKSFDFAKNKEVRENVFNWANKSSKSGSIKPIDINPIRTIFSKNDEDIFSDPETLKGRYRINISILGKDVDLNFSKSGTCIFIMGKEPSQVRDLKGTYEDGKVKLDWDKPKSIGGSEILQYNIYMATTSFNYIPIGNVSGDKTDYIDDLDNKNNIGYHHSGFKGDILYYRVAAVNKDCKYYPKILNSDFDFEMIPLREDWIPLSIEEIVHIPIDKTKKSDMSYKWVMDYSDFGDGRFEERLHRPSIFEPTDIEVNEIEGGDVFFYDIDYIGKENGERKYEYQGGFYSKGKVDAEIQTNKSSSSFNIDVKKSWIDFSGEIWAKEISNEGYEGLTITKQTIESKGEISSDSEGSYDFDIDDEDKHWEASKEIEIEWNIDLTLDYNGNNSWIIDREKNEPSPNEGFNFSYKGSMSTDGDIELDDNHDYNNNDTKKSVDKKISGRINTAYQESVYSYWTRRKFTPIIGASRVGYSMALDKMIGPLDYSELKKIDTRRFHPIRNSFLSNCQPYNFSMENLYGHQCLDPMILPGLGSLLGTELKKSETIYNNIHAKTLIRERLREELARLDKSELNSSQIEKFIESEEKRLKKVLFGDVLTVSPVLLDQQIGPLGIEMLMDGMSYIEPMGYFGSNPLDDGDLKRFEENKEEFFDDQISDKDKDGQKTPGFSLAVLMVSILFVMIYRYKR